MNFNFVSIPRCASQSIHNAFRTEKFMNHKSISLFPDQTLFSFAVIRDPVDRVRSWWSWHRAHKKLEEWYPESFEEWCKDGFVTHWTEGDCMLMGITHALRQIDYISIDGKIAVNYLLDYSRLEKQIIGIGRKLGFQPRKLLRMGNAEKFPVAPKIQNLIKETFPEDFALYRKVRE